MLSDLPTPWQRKWLGLRVTHPQVQAAASTLARWTALVEAGLRAHTDGLLVIVGNPGCGKTTMAKGVAAWFRGLPIERRVRNQTGFASPIFAHWPTVAASFLSGEFGSLQDMVEADPLILDDVGAEHDSKSEIVAGKLCELLSRRFGKFTLITTNVPPDQAEARYDARVASRLWRSSKIVMMDKVPDFAVWKAMGGKQ